MTNMNEHSSRSHMMLTVTVISENKVTGVVTRGKLNLVDLAGSERLNKSGPHLCLIPIPSIIEFFNLFQSSKVFDDYSITYLYFPISLQCNVAYLALP